MNLGALEYIKFCKWITWRDYITRQYFSFLCHLLQENSLKWVSLKWPGRPIQSISHDVHLFDVCLSPLLSPGTPWAGDFWSKSISLKLQEILFIRFGPFLCFDTFGVFELARGGSVAVPVGVGDRWQVTGDKWKVACDMWHVTNDKNPITHDMWHGVHTFSSCFKMFGIFCTVTTIHTHWDIYCLPNLDFYTSFI